MLCEQWADGGMPPALDQRADILLLKVEVRRDGPSEAHRLNDLEDENRRLKKLLAESMLDVATLKGHLTKN